jgi:formate dehydrogenase gamma subunit
MPPLLKNFPVIFLLLAGSVARAQVDNDTCLGCHADQQLQALSERGKGLKLQVSPDALRGSVHEDLACTDCHGGADDWEQVPHGGGKPLEISCGRCHQEEENDFYENCVHGRARRAGNNQAPTCIDCHGGHQQPPLKSEQSPLSPQKQPQTCGRCHGGDELAGAGGAYSHITRRRLIARYQSSVHWKAIKEGKTAASCSDCHGAHDILSAEEPHSQVSRIALLNVCVKCHKTVVQAYSSGSHGRALLKGNSDVPNCVACHGDHDVISLRVAPSGVRDFAATQICIWCHGNERMMRRYALDTAAVESYQQDFHGLTQRSSQGTSATCADCHDAHRVLPASNPQAPTHPANRAATCGKCHGVVPESFALSFSHRRENTGSGRIVELVVIWCYAILISLIVGGMFLHNLIIWVWAVRNKIAYQRKRAAVIRMSRFERIWHLILLVSFFMLVFTGFELKFSDSSLFAWLHSIGFRENLRSFLHRLAAIVLIGSLFAIACYPALSRRGRVFWKSMLPGRADLIQLRATLRHYLNRGQEKTRQGMYGYVEKAEFWALLWGSMVMIVTGLVLWFPKMLPESWPAWLIDVARLVHFLEAILATLSIIIWHLFHTIFHPLEYPMDTSWIGGVLSAEEAGEKFTPEAVQLMTPEKPPDPQPPRKPVWMEKK